MVICQMWTGWSRGRDWLFSGGTNSAGYCCMSCCYLKEWKNVHAIFHMENPYAVKVLSTYVCIFFKTISPYLRKKKYSCRKLKANFYEEDTGWSLRSLSTQAIQCWYSKVFKYPSRNEFCSFHPLVRSKTSPLIMDLGQQYMVNETHYRSDTLDL